MKWTKKIPQEGDKRIRSGFLFFPKCIYDNQVTKKECRWLEHARWEQEYGHLGDEGFWSDTRWIY